MCLTYSELLSKNSGIHISFPSFAEGDQPFNAPPLPRWARGVPQAGAFQVGTLKPRSA
jgi:hypothetical protein